MSWNMTIFVNISLPDYAVATTGTQQNVETLENSFKNVRRFTLPQMCPWTVCWIFVVRFMCNLVKFPMLTIRDSIFFVSLYLFMLLIVQYYYFDGLTFTWFTELMLLNTCTEEESQVFIFVALSYTIHLSVASRYSVKRNAQSIAQFSPLGWSMDSSIVDANFHTLRTRKSHLRGLQTRQGSGKVGGTHFRNDRRPIANGLSIGASFDDEWLFCTTSSFF